MTQTTDFMSLWQSNAPDIKAEALKLHIRSDLALRRRFRIAILTAQTIPVILALWMDIHGLITLRWLATAVTLICLIVQVYKMDRSRNNRHVALDLTPHDALTAALQQNKINIRNAWIFSDVIPLSGLIGGLIGGVLSRLIMSPDITSLAGNAKSASLILTALITVILTALLASHFIGKHIGKQKKAERAILRKRLTLLEAGFE